MSFRGGFLWAVVVLAMVSCQSNEKNVEVEIIEDSNVQTQAINAVLWHQTAAEYKALCYQTYNLAEMQLKKKLQNHAFPYEKPPAVVMDLDETVVDNSFFNAQLILDNTNFSKEQWKAWSDLQNAGEVPGAIQFIKFARAEGVKVIFVSNRRVAELENTMKNLEKLGLNELDSNDFFLRSEEGSKANRRKKVSENYEILMLFGDNLADFTELFDKQPLNKRTVLVDSLRTEFGSYFMVLPNALYGEWEGALFDYQRDWTPVQKDSIRKSLLKGF